MKKKITSCLVSVVACILISVTNSFAFGPFGADVNANCAPQTPYTGDCTLCHVAGDFAAQTDAKDAYLAGGMTLTDFFCPAPPVCTDNDQDTYAAEGGDCGPMDCNDMDPAINPGAPEVCTDGIDNNCNGLIDAQDPAAVGCPPICTDNDGDGFAVEGGDCGPMDCNDMDAEVNPDAIEICTDGIDNNCNGLVDALDPAAVDCPVTCTDNDGDLYAIEGGECGPVDCDDNDFTVNPGAMEVCDDGIDNNCNGEIDEGCDVTCPDADQDGYADAACGGTDCNDNDPMINPGMMEICGNGIDENCNGMSDDICTTCPDGTLLFIKMAKYIERVDMLRIHGKAKFGTTITIMNGDTGEVLAEGVPVKGCNWHATLRNIGGSLDVVRVMTDNGCTDEKTVTIIKKKKNKKNNKKNKKSKDKPGNGKKEK